MCTHEAVSASVTEEACKQHVDIARNRLKKKEKAHRRKICNPRTIVALSNCKLIPACVSDAMSKRATQRTVKAGGSHAYMATCEVDFRGNKDTSVGAQEPCGVQFCVAPSNVANDGHFAPSDYRHARTSAPENTILFWTSAPGRTPLTIAPNVNSNQPLTITQTLTPNPCH